MEALLGDRAQTLRWDPFYLLLLRPFFFLPHHSFSLSSFYRSHDRTDTPPSPASSTTHGRRRPCRHAAPPAFHPRRTTPPFLNPQFPYPRRHHSPGRRHPRRQDLRPAPASSTHVVDALTAVLSTRFVVRRLPPPSALPGLHPPLPWQAAPPPPAVPPTNHPHRRFGCLPGHSSRSGAHGSFPNPDPPNPKAVVLLRRPRLPATRRCPLRPPTTESLALLHPPTPVEDSSSGLKTMQG